MDKQAAIRLQKEIKYWTDVISSHKKSSSRSQHNVKFRKFPSTKFVWNSTKNKIFAPNNVGANGQVFQKVSSMPSASSTFFHKNSPSGIRTNISYLNLSPHKSYKWTKTESPKRDNVSPLQNSLATNFTQKLKTLPIPSASRSSFKWECAKMEKQNTVTNSFKEKKTSLPQSVEVFANAKPHSYTRFPVTPVGVNAKLSPKLILSTSSKANPKFSWSKRSLAGNKTNTAPSVARKRLPPKATASNSKYRYIRKRSLSSDKSTGTPSKSVILRKRILTKYKLLRVSHTRSPVNLSKNPYKVIKKQPANKGSYVQSSKSRFRKRNAHFSYSPSHRHSQAKSYYVNDRKVRKNLRYRSKSYDVRNQFKLVYRNTFKPIHRSNQTRSRSSGNIVLKRKQQSVISYAASRSLSLSVKQRLASNVVHRSLETVRSKNRHKLKKVHCIFYNRFGKCNRGDKCPYVHDPDRVAICTQYLRGTCRDKNCPFSHKTSKQKMPVCNFFLRGSCSAKDCQYLHVFLGHDARICKAFVKTGYCAKGETCKDLHIRACPDFYETGKCEGKCNLPHRKKALRYPKSAIASCSSKDTTEKLRRSKPEVIAPKGDGFISLVKSVPSPKKLVESKPHFREEREPSSAMRIQPRLKFGKQS